MDRGQAIPFKPQVLIYAQVSLILTGGFRLQFPVIINSTSDPLTLYSGATSEPYLLYALIDRAAIISRCSFIYSKYPKRSG
jgi:cytochrome bd-type quinol oxidase subunit 2